MKCAICFSFFIAIFMLCLLTGCTKPCKQSQVANFTFTQDDLGINPYSGQESLLFMNQFGDSCVFPKGNRGNKGEVTYEIDYETAKEYYNHCQGDYFYHEYNFWETHNTANNSRLDIYLSFAYTFSNPVSDKLFTTYLILGDPADYNFHGTFKFNHSNLFNYTPPGSYLEDSIVSYHDSLLIGTRYFQNVYELFSHNSTIAFYSIKDGIVGFNTTDGAKWFLNKKY
ncbi:MAG: hypothetical protein ACOYNC_15765 [Bacteroidales bacterium]